MTTDTMPPQPASLKTIGTLAEALRFTDDDLRANRDGRLSDAQIYLLRAAWQRALIIAVVALIIIGLIAALLIYQGQQPDSAVLSVIGVALTLVNAAIMGLLAQNTIRLNADLRASSLIVTRGTVTHTVKIYNRAASYLLDIEGERLIMSKSVFFAFADKESYALYRTASSKTLLSAERV